MPVPAPTAEQYYYEDLQVGATYRYPSQTITETHFQLFSAITGDFHPLHLDKHYIQEKTDFEERVAHGLLNTIFTALGASELAPHIHESAIAFLGQSSEFYHPVYVGDTLYPECEIAEKRLTGDGERGVVTFESRIYNHREDQILSGELTYMFRVKSSDGYSVDG